MPEPSGSVPPIVAVVGATASGKSGLAVDLAERLGGEVVNTDAMAVYRGMEIGTAVTPVAERRGVPHHLLGVLEVREPLAVAEFQAWARDCIRGLRERGVVPVLVGGSALYTRAVLDRFEFPGTDADLRARLEAEAERVGTAAMYARLAEVDADAADRIEPGNLRRIVRALEVIELTGRPFRASLPRQEYADPATRQLGIAWERPELDERIAQRVERMFADGLVEEVRRLMADGLAESRTASRAIGYREVMAHLAGELTLAEAQERTVIATRRFVRRQQAWFGKDPRIVWLPGATDRLPDRAVAAVTEWAAGRPGGTIAG